MLLGILIGAVSTFLSLALLGRAGRKEGSNSRVPTKEQVLVVKVRE
jgi:hypothetical protein